MVRHVAGVAIVSLVAGCTGGGIAEIDRGTKSVGGASTGGAAGSGGAPGRSGGATGRGGIAGAPVTAGAGGTASGRGGVAGGGGGVTGYGGTAGGPEGWMGSGGVGTATASHGGDTGARGGAGAGGSVASGGRGGSSGVGGGSSVGSQTCASLPAVADYGAPGPFGDATMFTNVGPSGNYTLFRPDATLGKNGFLHPVVAWGNGISTTPDMYQKTLPLIASHGFVIIACNDTQVEEPCLSSGLDWLIQQNSATGPMNGKLDTTNEVVIGYSWGGGASIDTSVRPNVKATVSLHGMPPRESPWSKAHAPLLLFTSTGDNFVTADGYVTPNYEASTLQTFYATLDNSTAGHLYVVDEWATICIGSLLGSTFGNCGNGELEHAPTIAWLRLWACGDANAKQYFYGENCVLCQSPWTNPQRKNWK